MKLLQCLHRRRFAVEVVNKTRLPIFFFSLYLFRWMFNLNILICYNFCEKALCLNQIDQDLVSHSFDCLPICPTWFLDTALHVLAQPFICFIMCFIDVIKLLYRTQSCHLEAQTGQHGISSVAYLWLVLCIVEGH